MFLSNGNMMVLKHIRVALVNDHNIIGLSNDPLKQYDSLLKSLEIKENSDVVKRK
jgi:hypothetical protein